MLKKYFSLLCFFGFFGVNFAQYVQLSVYSEVSIITAGPGDELYTTFGHSAIRIKDPLLKIDLIYNYGMFDFNAPNFYSNFVKGKLIYKLARYPFKYFTASNRKENRWIQEQTLDVTQQERQQFFEFLETNAQPENASYLYDPFFNNCATKISEIATKILGNKIVFKNKHLTENVSIRQLMNRELHWNTWGNFGINLALGTTLDQIATPKHYQYLPNYVLKAFENSFLIDGNSEKPAILKTTSILKNNPTSTSNMFWNPFVIFSCFALLGIWITFKDWKKNTQTVSFDIVLFASTGVIGIVILFLWFCTNHATTPNNMNFLWAFAPNLIVAFFLMKKSVKYWMYHYTIFILLMLGVSVVLWVLKIQQFPLSILPIFLLLSVRYAFLMKWYGRKKKAIKVRSI